MNYKIVLPILIAAATVSACKNETAVAEVKPAMPALPVHNPTEHFSTLRWVETASPIKDAEKALSQNDNRLWGYHDRGGPHIIGVAHSETEKTLKQYQLRRSPGISDVIYGDRHEQLRTKFFDYAKQYNQIILAK